MGMTKLAVHPQIKQTERRGCSSIMELLLFFIDKLNNKKLSLSSPPGNQAVVTLYFPRGRRKPKCSVEVVVAFNLNNKILW